MECRKRFQEGEERWYPSHSRVADPWGSEQEEQLWKVVSRGKTNRTVDMCNRAVGPRREISHRYTGLMQWNNTAITDLRKNKTYNRRIIILWLSSEQDFIVKEVIINTHHLFYWKLNKETNILSRGTEIYAGIFKIFVIVVVDVPINQEVAV